MPSTDFQIGCNIQIRDRARLGRVTSLITQDVTRQLALRTRDTAVWAAVPEPRIKRSNLSVIASLDLSSFLSLHQVETQYGNTDECD